MTSKFATLVTAAALLGASFLAATPASAQRWHGHPGYVPAPQMRPHAMPAPGYHYGPPRHGYWKWRRHHSYGWRAPHHPYYGW